jgi:epoxyqueuosine reductase QueG
MFKTLAAKTGLGQLGDSFLFMNTEWGPWIHLRVVLTGAVIETEPRRQAEACTHCGRCIEACPSGAIMENGFDGLRCRNKMREIRNALGNVPYVFECERCLRACPVGVQPREVLVSYE